MENEIRRAQAFVEAVGDACEFLGIDQAQFFAQARRWSEVGAALWENTGPDSFYTAWQGEAGRANLCANVIDQFSRVPTFYAVDAVFDQFPVGYYLDYGCGSGVVSFPYLAGRQSAVMVDVPNLAQEFVTWRAAKHNLRDVAVMQPDAISMLPDEMFDFIVCIDVLEHLTNPTQVICELDRLLKPGGYLLHRSPWARPDEDLGEHLPEATADWHRPGGGQMFLATRYTVSYSLDFGGLYRKR